MARTAEVYLFNVLAGRLVEDEAGYLFQYEAGYLAANGALSVSVSLPLQAEPFRDKVLFPFFDGLIPKGWLLAIAEENWKLSRVDKIFSHQPTTSFR